MAIINILKDGTIVDDMSTVTVPKNIMESIVAITEREDVDYVGRNTHSKSAKVLQKRRMYAGKG